MLQHLVTWCSVRKTKIQTNFFVSTDTLIPVFIHWWKCQTNFVVCRPVYVGFLGLLLLFFKLIFTLRMCVILLQLTNWERGLEDASFPPSVKCEPPEGGCLGSLADSYECRLCVCVCMCPFVTTAKFLLTSLLVSSSCLGEFHSTWWKRSYASGNPLRFPQITDHNSRTKFIFCCSQRFSAWDPRGIKLVARANENLLNTLVFRTGENWPQLVIRCSHHQSESTSVFMAAVHFLCWQLVAMDHKAENTLTNGLLPDQLWTHFFIL